MLNVLSADEQFLAIINRSVDNRMIFYFIVSIEYFTLNKQDTQKNHDKGLFIYYVISDGGGLPDLLPPNCIT